MAETLEEIYNGTLTPDDFTNGEATILTTDANTRYVIKDVQVAQGDANFPIEGNITVNGFGVTSTTTNSSGSEIVGPNSTIAATTDFSLDYKDYVIYGEDASQRIVGRTSPTVNDITGLCNDEIAYTSISGWPHSTETGSFRQYWVNIGPDNKAVFIKTDTNSTTYFYVMNSAGSEVYNMTSSYLPVWFDGERYAYWLDGWDFRRYDVWTLSITYSPQVPVFQQPSNYPNMFGYKDEFVIGWGQYNSAGQYPVVWNLKTGGVYSLASSVPNDVFSSMGSSRFFVVKVADGTFKIVVVYNTSTLRVYSFEVGDTFNSAETYESVSLSPTMSNDKTSKAVVGSKLFYLDVSNKLCSYDFDTKQIAVGSTFSVSSYGANIWGAAVTASTADIASRTYDMNPSLGLRITGIKSV